MNVEIKFIEIKYYIMKNLFIFQYLVKKTKGIQNEYIRRVPQLIEN